MPSPKQLLCRNRWSMRRKALVIFITLAALWGGFEIVWRVTAVPAPVIDYHALVYEHTSSFQPKGENGWDAFLEVIALFDAIEAETLDLAFEEPEKESIPSNPAYLNFEALREAPFAPELFPREMYMLKLLEEDGVFERMDEALDKPRLLRPQFSGGLLIAVRLPALARFRSLAQARVAALHVAARRGEWDAFVRGYEYTLALAHTCSMQAFVIDRVVGLAIAALAFDEMQHLLVELNPDEATCRALLEVMDLRLIWPPWELTFESERYAQLDSIQVIFTDDGHGDGRLDSDKVNSLTSITGSVITTNSGVLGKLDALRLAGRKETTERVNAYFDQIIDESHWSYSKRAASGFDTEVFYQSLTYRLSILTYLIGSKERAITRQDVNTLIERATRIMIHLEIHRHQRGEYLETLNELIGDMNPENLIDPFNDKPFFYRRLSDEANGIPYVLYSLGVDGIDQHAGVEITDVLIDFPYSTFTEEGVDILLSRPRETRQEYDQ